MSKHKRSIATLSPDEWPSSDKTINDASKPLHIPSRFSREDPVFDQIVYTLGYLVEGSADQVAAKWLELGTKQGPEDARQQVKQLLEKLFELGKIGRRTQEPTAIYHLHKETHAHTGSVKA